MAFATTNSGAWGISFQPTASFSAAQPLDDALVTGQIYPFMDQYQRNIDTILRIHDVQALFIGNFVDRVHSFDLSTWKPSFWNAAT